MNIEEIDKWLYNEYGISYTKLGKLRDYFFEKYIDQKEEIERLNNIKKKAINELFDLKDMIYKPETREINFDIQNKISSIIKILGSEKE